MGGTEITIKGKNFSPVQQQNQVLVDVQFCKIKSATESEIVCVTPPHDGSYLYEVEVDVLTRITEKAACMI